MEKAKRFTLRMRFALLTMVALLLVLSACSKNTTSPSASPDAKATTAATQQTDAPTSTPAPVKHDPVTLKMLMWSNAPAVEAVKKINDKFHEKYPYITVDITEAPGGDKYNQLQDTRIGAKDVDIMANNAFTNPPVDWAKGADPQRWVQWIDAGVLADLTGQGYLNNYTANSIKDTCTYKDKVYCVNTGAYPFTGVFYNKDIFTKYNLKVPTTWAELTQVVKTLQDNKVLAMTLGGGDGWPIALPSEALVGSIYPDVVDANKKLWTGEAKFTDPQGLQYFTRMQQLMNWFEPNWQGISYTAVVGRFASGAVAMLPDGLWQLPAIEKANPALNMGYFPLPGSDDAANNTHLEGKYDLSWLALASSKHLDEVNKWLDFFSQKDNYTDYANAVAIIPVQDGVTVSDKFIQNEIMPQMSNFQLAMETHFYGPKNAGQYAGFVPDFLAPKGKIKTPEEMAQLSQKDWEAAVKAAK